MERLKAILSEKLKTKKIERIDKPWGYELLWAKTQNYVGKILVIHAGQALSLQFHRQKEETMYLESGTCEIETGESRDNLTKLSFSPGEVFHIPPGRLHRIFAKTECRIFEVSTPHLDDVIRLEDNYGRAT